jgi:hypothetical protein
MYWTRLSKNQTPLNPSSGGLQSPLAPGWTSRTSKTRGYSDVRQHYPNANTKLLETYHQIVFTVTWHQNEATSPLHSSKRLNQIQPCRNSSQNRLIWISRRNIKHWNIYTMHCSFRECWNLINEFSHLIVEKHIDMINMQNSMHVIEICYSQTHCPPRYRFLITWWFRIVKLTRIITHIRRVSSREYEYEYDYEYNC